MFGHRVQAMQVANGYGEGIDPSRRYECPRAVRRRKRLAYLGVVDGLGMDAGAATEVVRFALHACARGLRVLDDLASGRDDLLVGRVPLRLAQVNMNELEPGIDRRFGGFHARRMIQVDVHLDAEFDHIIVNHRTEIAQADHLDLAMARLHEDRALPRRGGSGDRGERFLVVDVEGAEGKAFLPRPGVEGASGFSTGHEKTPFRVSRLRWTKKTTGGWPNDAFRLSYAVLRGRGARPVRSEMADPMARKRVVRPRPSSRTLRRCQGASEAVDVLKMKMPCEPSHQ